MHPPLSGVLKKKLSDYLVVVLLGSLEWARLRHTFSKCLIIVNFTSKRTRFFFLKVYNLTKFHTRARYIFSIALILLRKINNTT